MKEYKVESTWTRHVIVLPSVRLTSTPHSFTKGGKLIATNDSGHVKFNTKDNLAVFTETLLSLPDDFVEARKDETSGSRQEE